jgi:hypothetical protein
VVGDLIPVIHSIAQLSQFRFQFCFSGGCPQGFSQFFLPSVASATTHIGFLPKPVFPAHGKGRRPVFRSVELPFDPIFIPSQKSASGVDSGAVRSSYRPPLGAKLLLLRESFHFPLCPIISTRFLFSLAFGFWCPRGSSRSPIFCRT